MSHEGAQLHGAALELPARVADAAPALAAQLIDSAPDGIVVADRDGVITMVNRRIEDLFGYERDELVGRPVEILLPGHVRRAHVTYRQGYMNQPHVRPMGGNLDLWARRRDGAKFPVEVSLSPLHTDDDQLVIATVRDVSVRREAEQRMRNMTHLFGVISDAVLLADPDSFVFTYVNTAACTLTGFDADELVEMTPSHLVAELDIARLRRLVDELTVERPRSRPMSTLLRRRDGREMTVEVEVELPPSLPDQPAQVVVLIRDITDRLLLESEARSGAALRALVDERERIAGDLHDTVIQDLFGAGLTLQATAMRADPASQVRVMESVDRIDDIIRRIRMTIFHLTDRRGDGGGLRQQVMHVVEEAARILGFRPALDIDGPVDTAANPAVVEHLIPALRESLSNVARHAHATSVSVSVTYHDATFVLRVVDNGIGAPDAPSAGSGLRNLMWRAGQLGGTATVTRAEPSGTIVTWTVPA